MNRGDPPPRAGFSGFPFDGDSTKKHSSSRLSLSLSLVPRTPLIRLDVVGREENRKDGEIFLPFFSRLLSFFGKSDAESSLVAAACNSWRGGNICRSRRMRIPQVKPAAIQGFSNFSWDSWGLLAKIVLILLYSKQANDRLVHRSYGTSKFFWKLWIFHSRYFIEFRTEINWRYFIFPVSWKIFQLILSNFINIKNKLQTKLNYKRNIFLYLNEQLVLFRARVITRTYLCELW